MFWNIWIWAGLGQKGITCNNIVCKRQIMDSTHLKEIAISGKNSNNGSLLKGIMWCLKILNTKTNLSLL